MWLQCLAQKAKKLENLGWSRGPCTSLCDGVQWALGQESGHFCSSGGVSRKARKLWAGPFSVNNENKTRGDLNSFPALTLPSTEKRTSQCARPPPAALRARARAHTHTHTHTHTRTQSLKAQRMSHVTTNARGALFPSGRKTQGWPYYEWISSKTHRIGASERSHYGDQSRENECGLREPSKVSCLSFQNSARLPAPRALLR